jgi:anti-sigma factor RsiW
MSDTRCGAVRDLIPDFAASRLARNEIETVERHLSDCRECLEELELAQTLYAARAPVPEGLLERVRGAVLADLRAPARPSRVWWGLSAAAVAALALGIGISSEPIEPAADVPGFAYEVEEGVVWSSDDGLFAGAPLFERLSDDALLELLDELSAGGQGGAA